MEAHEDPQDADDEDEGHASSHHSKSVDITSNHNDDEFIKVDIYNEIYDSEGEGRGFNSDFIHALQVRTQMISAVWPHM